MYGGRRAQLGAVPTTAGRPFKLATSILRSFAGRISLTVVVLVYCAFSLMSRVREDRLLVLSKVRQSTTIKK